MERNIPTHTHIHKTVVKSSIQKVTFQISVHSFVNTSIELTWSQSIWEPFWSSVDKSPQSSLSKTGRACLSGSSQEVTRVLLSAQCAKHKVIHQVTPGLLQLTLTLLLKAAFWHRVGLLKFQCPAMCKIKVTVSSYHETFIFIYCRESNVNIFHWYRLKFSKYHKSLLCNLTGANREYQPSRSSRCGWQNISSSYKTFLKQLQRVWQPDVLLWNTENPLILLSWCVFLLGKGSWTYLQRSVQGVLDNI